MLVKFMAQTFGKLIYVSLIVYTDFVVVDRTLA